MADQVHRNITKKRKGQVLSRVRELIKARAPKGEYIEAIGRRKTATARVRLVPAKENTMVVNGLDAKEYFKTDRLTKIAREALDDTEVGGTYSASVFVRGSGMNAQAEAIRLGVARAMVQENEDTRSYLKHKGWLKRDPRSVERKKFGLLKARKAPTWVKR
ncbi:MAG: 30S ribosomal protein S9 [Patescibacteria group bacterium]